MVVHCNIVPLHQICMYVCMYVQKYHFHVYKNKNKKATTNTYSVSLRPQTRRLRRFPWHARPWRKWISLSSWSFPEQWNSSCLALSFPPIRIGNKYTHIHIHTYIWITLVTASAQLRISLLLTSATLRLNFHCTSSSSFWCFEK